MIDKILHHPYHHSGAVIARLGVCGGTLIWALVVLAEPNALAITRYGAPLTAYVPEDWIALAMAALALGLLYRVFRPSPPHPWGVLANLIMAIFWLYADIMIATTRPWQPTSLAWVTVGVVLAAFALVANPRPSTDAHRVGL